MNSRTEPMYRCDGATGWAIRFSIPDKSKKFPPLSKRQSGPPVDPTGLLCKVPELFLTGGESLGGDRS